jgi:adenylate cyclase
MNYWGMVNRNASATEAKNRFGKLLSQRVTRCTRETPHSFSNNRNAQSASLARIAPLCSLKRNAGVIAVASQAFDADDLRVETTTIMFVDVVESLKLIGIDERAAVASILSRLNVIERLAQTKHAARVVESRGDGILLQFSNPTDALECALSIASEIANQQNSNIDQSVRLRISLHTGEVINNGSSVYGSVTSLAARVASIANPGDIVATENFMDALPQHVSCGTEDLGFCYLKHVEVPQRITRLRPNEAPLLSGTATGETAPELPKVAVLVFVTSSGGGEDSVVGELLAESVAHHLSHSPVIKVVSWLSTRKVSWVAREEALQQELRCNYYVVGHVSLHTTRFVAHYELKTSVNDSLITRRLVGEIEDLLSSECQIASEISAEIVHRVVECSVERVTKHCLPSLPSFELMNGAIGLMHKSARDRFDRGRAAFEHLLDRHPRMHAVRPWLAKWYVLKTTRGLSDNTRDDAQRALEQTNRARDAKPDDSFAIAVSGFVRCHLLKDAEAGATELDNAIAVNPNDVLAHLYSATALGAVGRYEEAWVRANRAVELSPIDPQRYYFYALAASAAFFASEFQRAEQLARASIKLNAVHPSSHRTLTLSLVRLERFDEAVAACKQLQSLEPQLTVASFLANSIQPPQVRAELARLYREAGLPQT